MFLQFLSVQSIYLLHVLSLLIVLKHTCCSKSMVLMAWRQGRIIIGNPKATDIMKPTRIISVTRLDGKFISTLPSMFSVKLT